MKQELVYIEYLEELLDVVQMQELFPDQKIFVDAGLKFTKEEILEKYWYRRTQSDFNLSHFVEENFSIKKNSLVCFTPEEKLTVQEHVRRLWPLLTRKNTTPENNTLISLPEEYIIPGGRFQELFYWDSYFTMLGLQVSRRVDLIEAMINNFAYLIDTYGHIPNGTRSYLLSRSQPPFFSLMVALLAEEKGEDIFVKYLPQMRAEYQFWMSDAHFLNEKNTAINRVVRLRENVFLNRYWDAENTPRPEGYAIDKEIAGENKRENIYRNIRAACESGWDFSGRWFSDGTSIAKIITTDLIPVDLNCLLVSLEQSIAQAYQLLGNKEMAEWYQQAGKSRADAIHHYLWNEQAQTFLDYNFVAGQSSSFKSMAMGFPLFVKIASPQQAAAVCSILEEAFLKQGGLLTTLAKTGQQWDAPNGWAPLQWIGYKAAKNYGDTNLAYKISKAWTANVERVYSSTGKMMEKYNVEEALEAGGGEYPNQDGFGWTNGVYLKMKEEEGTT